MKKIVFVHSESKFSKIYLKTLRRWINFLKPDLYSHVWLNSKSDLENIRKFADSDYSILSIGTNVSVKFFVNDIASFELPHPSKIGNKSSDKKFEKAVLEACKEFVSI